MNVLDGTFATAFGRRKNLASVQGGIGLRYVHGESVNLYININVCNPYKYSTIRVKTCNNGKEVTALDCLQCLLSG